MWPASSAVAYKPVTQWVWTQTAHQGQISARSTRHGTEAAHPDRGGHARYCPAADPRFTYRGKDVVQAFERVCGQVGYPGMIQVDNGSEFITRDLNLWAYANDATLDFSRPGKPTHNGFIEAFNSKPWAECLNTHWFMSLADVREKLENWL